MEQKKASLPAKPPQMISDEDTYGSDQKLLNFIRGALDRTAFEQWIDRVG